LNGVLFSSPLFFGAPPEVMYKDPKDERTNDGRLKFMVVSSDGERKRGLKTLREESLHVSR
jgi:hypothetical protein